MIYMYDTIMIIMDMIYDIYLYLFYIYKIIIYL